MRRWLGAAAIAAVALVALPPFVVHEVSRRGLLEPDLGFPLTFERAAWSWAPLPGLELRGIRGELFERGPAASSFSAELVRIPLSSLFGGGVAQELLVGGLAARAGPFAVRDGRVRLWREDGALRVKGRARGEAGGWVELDGDLDGPPGRALPLRLFLGEFRVDLPPGPIALDGALHRRIEGPTSEAVEVDLRIVEQSWRSFGDWLRGSLRGRVVRRGGRIEPGSRLDFQGRVRHLGGERATLAVLGPLDVALDGEGDAGSGLARVAVDWSEVRVKLGEIFVKPAGDDAHANAELTLDSGVVARVRGGVDFAGVQIELAADRPSEDPAALSWRVRSGWVPLAELRPYVPWLAVVSPDVQGDAMVSLHRDATQGVRGLAYLRGVRIELGTTALVLPIAQLEFGPDLARLHTSGLELAGQRLALDATVEWVPSPGTLRVDVRGGADDLDLEAVADALGPLLATEGTSAASLDWRDVAGPVIGALRARPRLLDILAVDALELGAGRVRGLGLDAADVRIRLALVDGLLRFERAPSAAGRHDPVTIDLRGWVPKIREGG